MQFVKEKENEGALFSVTDAAFVIKCQEEDNYDMDIVVDYAFLKGLGFPLHNFLLCSSSMKKGVYAGAPLLRETPPRLQKALYAVLYPTPNSVWPMCFVEKVTRLNY
ncbi:hypothetical protein O6H91_12G020700 [Diphasiastrum complanatum]|uniref:Uncharacterized protein n=1 Tax=Diphasiastrum complanatum TaxID=34168 RepID=A0ACC2C024_DIPCM|nr:hypothetical protein O6H91_12G020700 [Diphasiastrum complanatum]